METPAVTAAARTLGTSVSADLEALKNDVEQARELACEYQRQLAGKSNDHALLKSLFEKTRDDLVHLHKGIAELREERHRFANEAMKATALEMKLERMTRERDQLQNEVQALRNIRAGEADERVGQLTRELERLRRESQPSAQPTVSPKAAPKVTRTAEMIAVGFDDDEWGVDSVTIVRTDAEPGNAARKWRRK
jgi:predicted RNase H-like nuclease (RuvC/YqgF family)